MQAERLHHIGSGVFDQVRRRDVDPVGGGVAAEARSRRGRAAAPVLETPGDVVPRAALGGEAFQRPQQAALDRSPTGLVYEMKA